MNRSDVASPSTADLYDAHVMKNYGRPPLTLVRGSGSYVWDDQGRKFLDFTSGIAVCALGHCHPHWVAEVQRQAGELVHVSNLFRNPNQGELARRLVGYAGPGRVFFCNSGAEANEGLLKLARLHGATKVGGEEGKCYKVICAQSAFHGRTFGGMSATPQEKIQKGFRPLVPGFAFGELNNLASFEALIDDTTAAIFVETIQGEGGVNPATTEFLVGLRALCDRHNLLLILDEVQCGIGRTGKFYAFEHAAVKPDAIGMAKGLGGGFPIGAIWTGPKAAELFQPGMHGTTFGGTPLACAAGLAVLDVIERDGLLAHVTQAGAEWLAALSALAAEFPAQVLKVRGRGFMLGLQLASDPVPYVTALREAGLLAPMAGGNVVRLLPPLTASAEELASSVDIIRSVLAAKA
ncbi:MAG: aspartate aminotransferase family protein [Opitutus sp.]|nr:aspartate aminotransferase family protein [Opitutus sp.]MCS6248364.1 aspartate aminotransferase family protein [Opitutus sp.]MCS6274799.1 aspartate aminotransferase family protein [Opitutus sp.]MCS6277395.1 aspartate aminotransferase family protein [Opitutus sp.]MCS6300517.1 aspartate aminotransferase family protein [Opitutus sp.]